jgi:hypothetical protein
MESNLWFAFIGLIGAVIGALGVIAGQWISARHSERIEYKRWEQEKLKEVRQAMREYRQERARPVLNALDRASGVCSLDWGDLTILMDEIGYQGEEIKPEEQEAYEKEKRKRLKESWNKSVDDISTVGRIYDSEIREALYKALWKGVGRMEARKDEDIKMIDNAYRKLEAWILRPPDKEF